MLLKMYDADFVNALKSLRYFCYSARLYETQHDVVVLSSEQGLTRLESNYLLLRSGYKNTMTWVPRWKQSLLLMQAYWMTLTRLKTTFARSSNHVEHV